MKNGCKGNDFVLYGKINRIMAVGDRKYRLCKCSIRTIYPLKSKLKQKKSGKNFAVKTKLATFAAANRELKPLSKKTMRL